MKTSMPSSQTETLETLNNLASETLKEVARCDYDSTEYLLAKIHFMNVKWALDEYEQTEKENAVIQRNLQT